MKPPSPGISTEADHQAKLVEARQIVVKDPEILKGTPVIRGTRIPVHDIAASIAAGLPRERIREAWPTLDDRMIELASIYAKAHPRSGRGDAPSTNAPILSERRVARRRPR